MRITEGSLVAQNIRVGIVASRFNEFITSKLLSGARDALCVAGPNIQRVQNTPRPRGPDNAAALPDVRPV